MLITEKFLQNDSTSLNILDSSLETCFSSRYLSQKSEKTGQRDRGAEGKGEEDEIAKGREERPRLPGQVCLGKSFSSLGNHLRSGQVWRMSGKA